MKLSNASEGSPCELMTLLPLHCYCIIKEWNWWYWQEPCCTMTWSEIASHAPRFLWAIYFFNWFTNEGKEDGTGKLFDNAYFVLSYLIINFKGSQKRYLSCGPTTDSSSSKLGSKPRGHVYMRARHCLNWRLRSFSAPRLRLSSACMWSSWSCPRTPSTISPDGWAFVTAALIYISKLDRTPPPSSAKQ